MFKKTLVVDGITPVGAYQALRRMSLEGSFLLESVVPGERWGRYSILGYRPRKHITLFGEAGTDPFETLAQLTEDLGHGLEARELGIAERFLRAAVGVIPYDIVHYASKVQPWPELGPVARLFRDFTVVVFDNQAHVAFLAAERAEDLERAEHDLAHVPLLAPRPVPSSSDRPLAVDANMSDAEYGQAVERAKEYIRAGDAFQVVLARTFSVEAKGEDPFDVYRALRVLSPAPYMYLLEFPAVGAAPATAVIGASPETLVRVEGSRVVLRPLAGTRRRGRTPEEDRALAEELINDPKERAEHVMLIDLGRNDVGRVAVPGSVSVPDRMFIERHSHVMHIVSEVQGEVRPELGPWDVIRATFPQGTLTGAPKVRAMQIIRELEKRPRGVYGGAAGYVAAGRQLDLAIAIRTVVMQNGRFEVSAGAGIVVDSVPALESKETHNKAHAALSAIKAVQ